MNQNKRKLHSDDFFETNPSKYHKSITCFEDLSNELICEIFPFLYAHEFFATFSNLNYRFEQLLHSSYVLLKFYSCFFDNNEDIDTYKQSILLNQHQILSLHISFVFKKSLFFPYYIFNSSFTCLQSIIFKDIQYDTFILILQNLLTLPQLYSLTSQIISIENDVTDLYQLLFLLPKLRYARISSSIDSITFPIVLKHQSITLKYLIIQHSCSLKNLICLLSHTPNLHHLSIHQIHNDSHILSTLIVLSNLQSIHLNLQDMKFYQMKLFFENLSINNCKSLSILAKNDINYLNAYQWKVFILNNMSQLDTFYFIYEEEDIDSENNDQIFPGQFNKFSSEFWIEHQWIFDVEIGDFKIVYSILPYNKRWHQSIEYSKMNRLTIESMASYISEDVISRQIERILTINQIYDLEILQENLTIFELFQRINRLLDVTMLKIHSLSIEETDELTVQQLLMLCSIKRRKNQITKVFIEKMNDIKILDFIFILCPFIEYLKCGFQEDQNILYFIQMIFKTINYHKNPHFHSLCFYIKKINDQLIENIKQMIDDEKLFNDFNIERDTNNVYIQWK